MSVNIKQTTVCIQTSPYYSLQIDESNRKQCHFTGLWGTIGRVICRNSFSAAETSLPLQRQTTFSLVFDLSWPEQGILCGNHTTASMNGKHSGVVKIFLSFSPDLLGESSISVHVFLNKEKYFLHILEYLKITNFILVKWLTYYYSIPASSISLGLVSPSFVFFLSERIVFNHNLQTVNVRMVLTWFIMA